MSIREMVRICGMCMLVGSVLGFVGERMSYNYVHPTQNAFDSVLYVPGKVLVVLGVVLVLMGLPMLWAYLTPTSKVLGPLAVFLAFYGLTTPVTAFPLQLFLCALASHPSVQASVNPVARTGFLSGIVLLVGNLVLIVGVLLLGVMVLRTRVLPPRIGMLFIVAAVVKIADVAMPALTLYADLVFVIALFAGFGWTGYWLVRQAGALETPRAEAGRP
ncbi:MAG: hypothetical protein PVSMB4_17220 [Ktedonobacterales bacterium]